MRAREYLLSDRSKELSSVELLAAILGTGSCRQSVQGCAQQLLERAGSLSEVFSGEPAWLLGLEGLGQAKVARLLAVREIWQRLWETQRSSGAECPQRAFAQLADIAHQPQEVFVLLLLNSQMKVLQRKTLFQGSVRSSLVSPREIIREAVKWNATHVIVAHNHPSGDCLPSKEDRRTTSRLRRALALVDLKLIDHLIFGEGRRFFSFSENRVLRGEIAMENRRSISRVQSPRVSRKASSRCVKSLQSRE